MENCLPLKDDHFPVRDLKIALQINLKFLFSLETTFISTMMLLLNRHLTHYKWYFRDTLCHSLHMAACDLFAISAIDCVGVLAMGNMRKKEFLL